MVHASRFDCALCLETLDSRNRAPFCRHACGFEACRECVRRLVRHHLDATAAYVRPVRCPGCRSAVPLRVWAPVAGNEYAGRFARQATRVLTIRCGECHSSDTVAFGPYAGEEMPAAGVLHFVRLPRVRAAMVDFCAGRDDAADEVAALLREAAAGGAEFLPPAWATDIRPRAELLAAAAAARERGREVGAEHKAAAGRIDELRAFVSAQRAEVDRRAKARDASRAEGEQARVMASAGLDTPAGLVALARTVADPERRASFYMAMLRRVNPTVVTSRCGCWAEHCFLCQTEGEHTLADCAAFNARRGDRLADARRCPGCSAAVVLVEGCHSVECICGHRFQFMNAARV